MNKKNNGMVKNTLYYVLVLLAMVMVVYFIFGNGNQQTPTIEYSTFTEQLKDGKIKQFTVQPATVCIESWVNTMKNKPSAMTTACLF